MNPYLMLGSAVGTDEATSLSARLASWHDVMVAHARRLRIARTITYATTTALTQRLEPSGPKSSRRSDRERTN